MSLERIFATVKITLFNSINKFFPTYQIAVLNGLPPLTIPHFEIPFINYFAVPKKRTSHAKKRQNLIQMKQKPICHVMMCRNCGQWKLRHHLCEHCFKAGKIGKDYEIY